MPSSASKNERDQALFDAGSLALSMGQNLVIASLPDFEPAKRLLACRQAFTAWSQLCAAFAVLEALAPSSRDQGYKFAEQAAKVAGTWKGD